MAVIHEIAPDVFRICVHRPDIDLQFSQFLVRDDEPLLFHTLMNSMFSEAREAVTKLIDIRKLRWISFSHFEADECGSLNQWLSSAPHAQPVCSTLAGLVNVSDFSSRPPRMLEDHETLTTGTRRFRFIRTPHLPHGWDAGVMFEEHGKVLFCSDLCHQNGVCDPMCNSGLLERVRETLVAYQAMPVLADYMPYSPLTSRNLAKLAALEPRVLAAQHGSVYEGDGKQILLDLDLLMKEVLGASTTNSAAA
jgi:flavorubredoxin